MPPKAGQPNTGYKRKRASNAARFYIVLEDAGANSVARLHILQLGGRHDEGIDTI